MPSLLVKLVTFQFVQTSVQPAMGYVIRNNIVVSVIQSTEVHLLFEFVIKFNILIIMFHIGDDCSQVTDHGYWEVLKTSDFVPQGSASHTAVVWQDSMYIVGGESFKKGHMLYVYDFNGE